MKEQYVIEYMLAGEKHWQFEQAFEASEYGSQRHMDEMMLRMDDLKHEYPDHDFRLVYRQEQILGSTL